MMVSYNHPSASSVDVINSKPKMCVEYLYEAWGDNDVLK